MGILAKDFVTGRKTFFITPDLSLFPEHYLEEYFALGYECYFIQSRKASELKKIIETLVSVFPDAIFIFNIDFKIEGMVWETYISELKTNYGDNIIIGVTYVKKPNPAVKTQLERLYLFELGLRGGCIQLEYKKLDNFVIIQHLLYANQAQGRRKNIRALCNENYTFSFFRENIPFTGRLQDISLSHFSFVMPEGKLESVKYEVRGEVTLFLNGMIIKTKAFPIMKRETSSGSMFIYAFQSEDGTAKIEERYRRNLIPNLYGLMLANFEELMHEISENQKKEESEKADINNIEINS